MEKLIKKITCIVLVLLIYRSTEKGYEKILFSNSNLTEFFYYFFLSIFDHFQVIIFLSGFEPLRSRGGGTRILVVRPLKRQCLPLLFAHFLHITP